MTTQRRKFTIEGELQHSPELTTEVITKNLLRAIDAKSIYVDNSLPHFITICHFSISIDAVPTPNTMTELKPRPETVRKPFDPKKPLELRCKVPAVLMADDMRGDKPLLVRYLVPGESNETVAFYPRSGLVHEGSVIPDDCDLINIVEQNTRTSSRN